MSAARVQGTGRVLALAALAAGALLCVPDLARAQEGHIYGPTEVSSPPRPAHAARLGTLIDASYPATLRDNGLGGSVQVQFVVGTDGKVETESVEVLAATAPALAKAGKQVVQEIDFVPATKDGAPVRCNVVLPITYRPQ